MAALTSSVAIFAQQSMVNKNVNTINNFVSFSEDKAVTSAHPRLFLSDSDFDEIRELVRQMEGTRPENGERPAEKEGIRPENGERPAEKEGIRLEKASLAGTLAGIHMLTMSRAEAISADFSPLRMEFDASGLRMLETSRQALERILFCSYAYRYSKDRKFLDHVTFDLRTVCNFSTWNADRHFLDAAEMALAVGIAYDWLYDELSDDDRSAIVSALERNAFDPATDEDSAWFYWSEGNWNQVCNAGLATAALAVYGDRPEGVAVYGDRPEGVAVYGDRPEGVAVYGDRPECVAVYGDRPEGVAVYGDRPEGVAGDNNQRDSAVSCNTAFPSDSTIQKIITDAVWSNRRAMETIYSPEGCYAEGPNYWSYGNMFQAVLLSAFESATGSDQGLSSVEGFDKTAKYKQLTYRPNGHIFIQGGKIFRTDGNTFIQDGNILRTDGHIFNYSDNIDELKPAYPLWYFAWKFGDWSLIDQELHLLAEGKYSDSSEFRLLPLLMMYALRMPDAATKSEDPGHAKQLKSPSDRTQNTDTSDRIQTHINYGTSDRIQTYINYGTSDRLDDLPLMMVKGSDFYLGIKGGSPTTNHAHMDGGSFVYDAFGKSWAIDPSRASYTELERACSEQGGDFWDMSQESLRWQFQTMNNEGHSTITVNGKNFNVKGKAIINETISPTLGESQRASEESRKAVENQYGAVMNLSSLYEGELAGAERRIWIDGNGNLTVEDCLSALPGKDAELRWSFVTPANVTVSRKGITLENEGTMVLLRTKSKARISYRLFPSDSDAYSICGFEARVKGGEKVVFRSRVAFRSWVVR